MRSSDGDEWSHTSLDCDEEVLHGGVAALRAEELDCDEDLWLDVLHGVVAALRDEELATRGTLCGHEDVEQQGGLRCRHQLC